MRSTFRFPDKEELFEKVNSMTKYPSIPPLFGRDPDSKNAAEFPPEGQELIVREKIDGCNVRLVIFPGAFEKLYFGEEGITDITQWVVGTRIEFIHSNTSAFTRASEYKILQALPSPRHLLLHYADRLDFTVFYFEVFGGNISHSHNYTSKNVGAVGIRLLDVLIVTKWLRLLREHTAEEIAAWRGQGRQEFVSEEKLEWFSKEIEIPLCPRIEGLELHRSAEKTRESLFETVKKTACRLDEDGFDGQPEGVVLRTRDRSWMAKLKHQYFSFITHMSTSSKMKKRK